MDYDLDNLVVRRASTRVAAMLRAQRRTVAVAESATCGMITLVLGMSADASDYLLGADIPYATHVEHELTGDHGEDWSSAARALAHRAASVWGSDYGIGATGFAGPRGRRAASTIGVAAVQPGIGELSLTLRFPGSRAQVRRLASLTALDVLMRLGARAQAPAVDPDDQLELIHHPRTPEELRMRHDGAIRAALALLRRRVREGGSTERWRAGPLEVLDAWEAERRWTLGIWGDAPTRPAVVVRAELAPLPERWWIEHLLVPRDPGPHAQRPLRDMGLSRSLVRRLRQRDVVTVADVAWRADGQMIGGLSEDDLAHLRRGLERLEEESVQDGRSHGERGEA